MIAAAAQPTPGFATGWYGKVPAMGDFIARRIPPAFCEAWHRWLQLALDGSRLRLAGAWRDAFLSMPVWRFVFEPGILTGNACAGVMVPSLDAVGRHFPLAVVASLPPLPLDAIATMFAAGSWFDDAESIALSAIAPRSDFAALDTAIAGRPFRAEWLHHAGVQGPPRGAGAPPQMMCVEIAAGRTAHAAGTLPGRLFARAAWFAEASEIFGRTLLLCEALPSGEQLCAMMEGRWSEHGWVRREPEP